MATVIPLNTGDIIEVRFRYRMYATEMMNVLHYKATVDGQADFVTAMQALYQKMDAANELFARFSNARNINCSHYRTEYQIVYPLRYAYYRTDGAGAGQAPDAGESNPPNIGVAITRRGVLAGRGYSGTVHLPPMGTNDIVRGELTDEAKASLEDVAEGLKQPIEAAGG